VAVTSSTLYLLDSNMVGYIASDRSPAARRTMNQLSRHSSMATSAIVEGEARYGLARKPDATRIRASVEALLLGIGILPWDSAAARSYGALRARLAAAGTPLSTIDTLIAAHALSLDAILVTHDAAFTQVHGLRTVDWATDL
jgi:tRNA(fMet)-specific endonuclease VapC